MISLATSRAVLRPWVDDDVDDYVALCGDPEVMRFIGDGQAKSEADARRSFARVRHQWDERGYGLFAVERLDTGELAGFSGLSLPEFLPEIMPTVEVGWRLKRSCWGLGIASEATSAVLDWAFGPLGLDRLVAVIQVENTRSRRLADRLGMQPERRTITPDSGRWVDVLELRSEQWNGVATGSDQ